MVDMACAARTHIQAQKTYCTAVMHPPVVREKSLRLLAGFPHTAATPASCTVGRLPRAAPPAACRACDGQQLWEMNDQLLTVLNKCPARRILAGAVAMISAVIPAPCYCFHHKVLLLTLLGCSHDIQCLVSEQHESVCTHTAAAVAVSSVTTPDQHSCVQTTQEHQRS